jgi:hypothetical protein
MAMSSSGSFGCTRINLPELNLAFGHLMAGSG